MDIGTMLNSLFGVKYDFMFVVFGGAGILIGLDVILNFILGSVNSLFHR